MAAFRLPKSCIEEIVRLCAAYLWSGEQNSRKAKIAWPKVCLPKREGGLGIKSLEEVNRVCVLKLIWRLLSSNSLWVDWIYRYLIRGSSFWSVKQTTSKGSWIWRKILKYRDLAKTLFKIEVHDGSKVSIWFDSWSSLGPLYDIFGSRGFIDMGVPEGAKLSEVLGMSRSRRHRQPLLNHIEEEIRVLKNAQRQGKDVSMWRGGNSTYLKNFSSKQTWENIRSPKPEWHPHVGVWFSYNTPKYAFMTWLAGKDRLSTGDRMIRWNINTNTSCSFCDETIETRDHLFFRCPYSQEIWEKSIKRVMGAEYSFEWSVIQEKLTSSAATSSTKTFITRYVFQAVVHIVWCERNSRRHGDTPKPCTSVIRIIDNTVRNRLSSMWRDGVKKFEDGLRIWFATRF